MTTIAQLDTVMRLDMTSYQAGMLQAARTSVASLGQIQAEAQKTATMLDTVRKAVSLWAEIEIGKNIFEGLIEAQVQLQQIDYTLLSATGSSTDAANSFAFLRKESQDLGLSLPTAAEGFSKLSAAASASGVSLKDQQGLFDAFAKSSTTLHLSAAQSGRALLALQEMFSRGTIQSRQLNQQLGQAIPGSAARVRNAVMEMVKGTDLQGKSFEQLIKSGKLVTTEFMPALTTALLGTARGWQDASESLNSNLNRLSTAWFNLKNQISTGLFSDAVSNGAAALANNLSTVADALVLVAAGATARGISALGNAASSRITTSYQKSYTGPVMAASYTTEQAAQDAARTQVAADRAAAMALENSMYVEQALESASYQKNLQFELAGITDVTTAEVTRLRQALLLNDAMGTGAAADRAHTGILAQLEVAEAAQVAATERMTASQVAYNAAMDTSNVFVAKQAGLTAVSAGAQAAATVAQAGAAEARVAEAAIGGIGTKLLGAGKSLGTFAMSLVGGPWGVAALAIGGVGVAIYNAVKAAEQYERETVALTAAVQDQDTATADLVASFEALGNSAPISKLRDGMATIGRAIDQNTEKLKTQQDELAAMAARSRGGDHGSVFSFAVDTATGQTTALQLYSLVVDRLTGKQKALADNTEALRSAQERLQQDYSVENQELVKKYSSAYDGVREVLSNTELSVTGLTGALGRLSDAWHTAQGSIAQINAGRAAFDKYESSITAEADALEKKLRQKAMTGAQRLADDHAQALAAAKKGGTGESADQAAEYARAEAAQAGIDAVAAGKKATQMMAEHERAAASLAQKLNENNAALLAEVDASGKVSKEEAELAKIKAGTVTAYNNATRAEKASMLATATANVALEAKVKLLEQATRDTAAYVTELDKAHAAELTQAQELQDKLASIGQGTQETGDSAALLSYKRAADAADAESAKQRNKPHGISEDQYVKQLALHKQTLNDETAAYGRYTQDRLTDESDWVNGARTAWQNFRDEAANVAGQVDTLLTTAFTNMNDALINGLNTGTFKFKSFVVAALTGLEQMELKILESKALSAMFGGGDSSGGNSWLSALGTVFSDYATSGSVGPGTIGANMANGGQAAPNSLHQVAEGGRPELYQSGATTYLIAGSQGGTVTPVKSGGSGGGGEAPQINITIATTVMGDGSSQTSQKSSGTQSKLAAQLAEQMKGAIDQRLVTQSQPNGIIWKLLRGQAA